MRRNKHWKKMIPYKNILSSTYPKLNFKNSKKCVKNEKIILNIHGECFNLT